MTDLNRQDTAPDCCVLSGTKPARLSLNSSHATPVRDRQTCPGMGFEAFAFCFVRWIHD